MGLENTGRAIAQLRKRAGLTQSELAEKLGISDKAVSKWERGLSLPDISCLERLAELLDTEADCLLAGAGSHTAAEWRGILLLDGTDGPYAGTVVYDKPQINYLLSGFLLAGIRNIRVFCPERDRRFIEQTLGDGSRLGISLSCEDRKERFAPEGNTLLIYERSLFFGAELTRRLQKAMTKTSRSTALGPCLLIPYRVLRSLHGGTYRDTQELAGLLEREGLLDKKPLPRGFLKIGLDTWSGVADAAELARLAQRYGELDLCSLDEIARQRQLIV